MCGICGYCGKYSKTDLKHMVLAQTHRGPDGSGTAFFKNSNIGLGHNRLAIIDLSNKAKQPMFNEDLSVAIVFNGEIYNFADLRTKLIRKHNFSSASDTEVVIHAYEEWGYKCLSKLEGMFSFVIYDQKKDLLFGARDRLGEKPLKYCINEKGLLFSSELKALLEVLKKEREIDPTAISHYLTFQYVPTPQTGFKGINKLPPAHYFIYQNNKLTIKKYWELDFNHKEEHSQEEWKEIILNTLEQSVKSRLVSDVPVGALLSGGVDSSAVVAYMARNTKGKVNTYSIGFDDKNFDETKYSKIISDIYNTNHKVLNLTSNDLLKNLPDILSYYDEPLADNSIIPTFLVTKLTSKYVKVALDGDGGDENFGGYDRYTIVKFDQNIIEYVPKNILDLFTPLSDGLYKVKPTKFTERLLRYVISFNEPFYKKYVNYNCFFTNKKKYDLFSDDFKNTVKVTDSFEMYKNLYDKNLSLIDNALKIDINTYLPDDLLYKVDAASMANGLELRAPFLDHKLMEVFAKIPPNLKINLLDKKHILKKALVSGGILPPEVVYRRKRGFNAPLNTWFKGPLKDYLYESILSKKFTKYGIFKKDMLEKYLDAYYQTNLNYDNNIFSLLILAKWVEKYL